MRRWAEAWGLLAVLLAAIVLAGLLLLWAVGVQGEWWMRCVLALYAAGAAVVFRRAWRDSALEGET